MKLVAFDTATDDTVVGAHDGVELTFGFTLGASESGRPQHSQKLLGAVEEAAQALGGWDQVDRIAVGVGPGTFTGIRIGVATARGLALGSGVNAVGFSSLDALAFAMRPSYSPEGDRGSIPTDASRLAVIDARRGEAFAALYEPDGVLKWPPTVCTPEELCERVAESGLSIAAGGSGAIRFRDELIRAGAFVADAGASIHRLSPNSICESAAAAGISDPLEPNYLRLPDAQLWLQRDGK